MRDELMSHMRGEVGEARLQIAVGALAVLAAILLWRAQSPFAAAGIPLAVLGLLDIILGATAWRVRRRMVRELSVLLAGDPATFQREETARLARAQPLFRLHIGIDVALVVGGLATVVFTQPSPLGVGIGAALAGQGLFALALETSAHRRAARYQKAVAAILTDAGARSTQHELAE